MKTILRNFLSVLRRFKLATLLNIFGLSVAFAAFMMIMMQLGYDWTYDRSNKYADTIFRVDMVGQDRGQMAIVSRPLADQFIQSSPHIVAGALTQCWVSSLYFSVEEAGERNSYKESARYIYPSITNVFQFDMVEGVDRALEDPEKVLIPQSLAQKVFGSESAVGKSLKLTSKDLTVGGVYKDFPENSSLGNLIYLNMGDENLQNWGTSNYSFFIRVDKPENAEHLIQDFKDRFDSLTGGSAGFSWKEFGMDLRMVPLTDLHFCGQVLYDTTPKTSRQTLWLLFSIAFVIILIAGINFTNFSTALTPMRIRSINTQKVLGGTESGIRFALIMEAVAISLLSFLISVGLVHLAKDTVIATLVSADMSLMANLPLLLWTGLAAILVGMLAGLYPSFYMTSFQPALVLKGSFGLSPEGRKLRGLLIGVQYIASFSLIIGSIFMYLQNYYTLHASLGYDKDALIVTDLNRKLSESYQAFASQLKTYSGVEDVTFAEMMISSEDQYQHWGMKYKDQDISFQCLAVDPSFLRVMGIKVTEGRDFLEEDMKSTDGAFIFNQTACDRFGLQMKEEVDSARIVGVVPDIKFTSFRMEVTPMAFYVYGKSRFGRIMENRQYQYAYIKVKAGADLAGAREHVNATLRSFDSEYPFNVRFFDDVLNQSYEKEQHLSSLITIFSWIAIFISMVGVFGLVVFDSEYRRKEISIRKVLGSTTREILILFNKTYFRILFICFVVSAPLAWYAVARWLENFAYKTPMYWWVYAIALAFVSVLTAATVTFQNWRVANENPVVGIKSE